MTTKHIKAIISLSVIKNSKSIMDSISKDRDALVSMAEQRLIWSNVDKESRDDLVFLRSEIDVYDKKFSHEMSRYLEAMSYLEVYNDEFNQSSKWKRWMTFKQLNY